MASRSQLVRFAECKALLHWQGDDEARAAEDEQFGAPRGASGQWASCLRTVDPGSLQTTRRAPPLVS